MSTATNLLPQSVTSQSWGELFTDVSRWTPAVQHVWALNPSLVAATGIAVPKHIESGFPGTCAVFIVDKRAVVKFFPPFARNDFRRERYVLAQAWQRNAFLPRLLAGGTLVDRIEWPYLVTRYEPGIAWREVAANLGADNGRAVAVELGRAIRAFHQQPMANGPPGSSGSEWPALVVRRIREAPLEWAAATELPANVLAEASQILLGTNWFDSPPCLVHGDLTEDHILIEQSGPYWHLSCIIDWADAEVAGSTYEWVALWFGFCGQNDVLLRAFLSAYDPQLAVDLAFVRRLLAFTLLHRFGSQIVAGTLTPEEQRDCPSLATLAALLFPGLP